MFITRDVSLAAFIRYSGHMLHDYIIVKGRDGEWSFDITDEQARSLKIDYANSEIASFEGIRRGMSKQKYG